MIVICRKKFVFKSIWKYVISKVRHKECGLELDNLINVKKLELFEEWL